MPDKLQDLYQEWSKNNPDAVEFAVFAAGFTAAAVSMRSRALSLAQKLKGNDLINAIGSLPDIEE